VQSALQIRPDCRPNLRRQMLLSSNSAGATDIMSSRPTNCVRNAGDALVRTGNSGENEANFFSSPNSPKTNFLKNESADKNVSRGQMRDQIVAIRDAFV
jgi:hypothetical protein